MSFYMDESLDSAINHYLSYQEEKEAKYPTCARCGEPIFEEYYECEKWEMYCEDCAEEWLQEHKHPVNVE